MAVQQHDQAVDSVATERVVDNGVARADASRLAGSPFTEPASVAAAGCVEDEQTELMRLLDEVTHSIYRDDETDAVAEPRSGGFVVEETSGPPTRGGSAAPPVYGSPAPPGGSPFSYVGIPHAAKPPPPSFAEAIASTPPMSAVPVELSPLAAHYVPPMPAAQQDPILLRNEHGVFLLQPIAKPTPPYTPPSVSSPISPLPRYALPPAAQPQSHFLGNSLAQADGFTETHPPKKAGASPYSGVVGAGHILGSGAGAYTSISTSVKQKGVGLTPPPPYPA
ncbi:hypothetical protein DQ04_07161000 [Trypanosoma grayi]|uniref:hypothetical protein n=1 Tax=Trypanosoma grayi TaxID=71804 RepID=UPI0004F41F31|nr:hypothetical protein DQ04_07161000 [Trypanosoma grayi]KEG08448.1 hypothetical protein DQ04_07161000 [Trypanosoma grayi]